MPLVYGTEAPDLPSGLLITEYLKSKWPDVEIVHVCADDGGLRRNLHQLAPRSRAATVHSCRSARIGSTCIARWAGT